MRQSKTLISLVNGDEDDGQFRAWGIRRTALLRRAFKGQAKRYSSGVRH